MTPQFTHFKVRSDLGPTRLQQLYCWATSPAAAVDFFRSFHGWQGGQGHLKSLSPTGKWRQHIRPGDPHFTDFGQWDYFEEIAPISDGALALAYALVALELPTVFVGYDLGKELKP